MGGTGAAQREMQNLWGKGPIFVGAYQTIASFHAAVSGQISIRGRLKGPAGVLCTEGAGGLDALGQACRSIRHGQDVVVSGGIESPLNPYALTCQIAGGELSTQRDIRAAYRPFDVRANGYVPGEGGAIVLVEEIEHARRRSPSTIYGEIAGYAATNDGFHHTRPDPSGRQLARAISLALERASLSPDEVDVVFADASGVPQRDVIEARVIRETFGDRSRELPVTAPKTMTGRLSSGGGALDVAAALFSMREGCIPPTINLNHPAGGCNLHFVLNEAFEAKVNAALVIARGFGGFNSAMILRRLPEDAG
jgi:3-oxoacyl-(acyl-carrier-protein) synthase